MSPLLELLTWFGLAAFIAAGMGVVTIDARKYERGRPSLGQQTGALETTNPNERDDR